MAGLLTPQRQTAGNGLLDQPRRVDDRVAGLLGLDPSIQRGAILPFGRDASGEMVMAWPEMAIDTLKSLMLPGHVVQGGEFTPRDVTEMALDMGMLSSVAPAPAGAKRMFGGINAKNADLPMDEASRMARADEMFPIEAFHGTHAQDIREFDPSKGDLGTHFGTYEQANNRLLATGPDKENFLRRYGEGANVIPARIRVSNPVKLPDLCTWNDSAVVAEGLLHRGRLKNSSILDDALGAKETAASVDDFVKGEENRRLLDAIREDLESQGYDGVKYKNQVENEYGSHGAMRPDVEAAQRKKKQEIKEIETAAFERMPKLPDAPTEADLERFLAARMEDYLTKDERATVARLKDELIKASDNQGNYNDPHSYIVFDPAAIRSRFAAFDPARRDSTDILASYLGVPGIGMLDAMPQDDQSRERRGLLNN